MSDISNVLRKVIELDISLGLDGTQEALDEITRLTAEVERLKKEIIGRQAHDRMQVREIKHLTAENERLRAALLDREIDAQLRCEKIIRLEEELSAAGCDHCRHWFDRAALSRDEQ